MHSDKVYINSQFIGIFDQVIQLSPTKILLIKDGNFTELEDERLYVNRIKDYRINIDIGIRI